MSSACVSLLSLKIIRYLRSSEPILLTFSSVLSSLGPFLILFMSLLVGSLFGIADEFHRLTFEFFKDPALHPLRYLCIW